MLNLSRFTRFSWGKIQFGRFAPCKRFDISQLCGELYEMKMLRWGKYFLIVVVPYGTLRTGDIEDSDVEDKTLRTGDVEDRRH